MVNTEPYGMQLWRQVSTSGSFGDERVYCLSFLQRARFESTRIVENELRIAFKHELVNDIVQPTLWKSKRECTWIGLWFIPPMTPALRWDRAAIDRVEIKW